MKVGGQSWSTIQSSSKGVQTKFICSVCGRKYKMEWAKNNHEKLCKERFKESVG